MILTWEQNPAEGLVKQKLNYNMAVLGKIAPIKKEYSGSFQTIESSLAQKGLYRYPGTGRMFFPYKENGRYRTGLDENAAYLKRLPEDIRKKEQERIKKSRERLEKEMGGIDLGPKSDFYNYASKRLEDGEKVRPVKLGTKTEVFDLNDPLQEIQFLWLSVHPMIAPSLQAYNRRECSSECQFYVLNEVKEDEIAASRKKKINKAIIELDKLSDTRRKQIARLMGLPVTESATSDQVYIQIDDMLKQTEFKSGEHKGMAPINLFNQILQLPDELVQVKDLVELALMNGVVHKRAYAIYEGEVKIAETKEDYIQRLSLKKNQEELLTLENKVKAKRIINE